MPSVARIQIEQQHALIGINVTNAKLNITMPRPRMNINNEIPKMNIDWVGPSFKMDVRSWRSQTGRKAPTELMKSIAAKGVSEAWQGVAETARNGDFVADLTKPGNRIAQISRSKTLEDNRRDLTLVLMPQRIPDIEWNTGGVKVNWTNGNFGIDWQDTFGRMRMTVEPPTDVEVFLQSRPYIKVTSYVEQIGQAVDTRR